jgi:hypothetical protein
MRSHNGSIDTTHTPPPLSFYNSFKLLILQLVRPLRGPLPMQAQVTQKASDEILSDCLITIFFTFHEGGGVATEWCGGGSWVLMLSLTPMVVPNHFIYESGFPNKYFGLHGCNE